MRNRQKKSVFTAWKEEELRIKETLDQWNIKLMLNDENTKLVPFSPRKSSFRESCDSFTTADGLFLYYRISFLELFTAPPGGQKH